MRNRLWLIGVLLALSACGGGGAEAPAQQPEQKPTVFDPLTDSLERAKAVQQTVDEQAAEQRKQIEQAER